MAWPWERRMPENPWWPETGYTVGWPFAHTCGARCGYCSMKGAFRARIREGARWWSDAEAVAAWRGLAEKSGPGYILMTGLEPGDQLRLVGAVLQYHRGGMITNLTFAEDELLRRVPPDRVVLRPSFHPHLWDGQAEPFLAKVARLRAAGYQVPQAVVVGHPLAVPHLPDWLEAFRAGGLFLGVAPFIGEWQGKTYPAAYTAEEWAVIQPAAPRIVQATGGEPPRQRLVACGAGFGSAYVLMDGTVQRCPFVGGMGHQNFIRQQRIHFLEGPSACARETCPCLQYHPYHIVEEETAP